MDLPLTRRFARVGLLFVLIAASSSASAQILSPGKLAKAHANLEGLTNCTKCHGGGKAVSGKRCLACHTVLRTRVRAGTGLHGRMPPSQRACEKCHHDHRGRDYDMMGWPRGGKNSFDHKKTGWPLTGDHAKIACDKCHTKRLIVNLDVRQMLAKSPRRRTYLGLTTRCTSCHFDEHRGQLGTDCQNCHGTRKWKPAKFNHDKTDYPLRGKHRRVACIKCHRNVKDTKTLATTFPAPISQTYEFFKNVPHARCTDCHRDPHKGRFGSVCESCHTVNGWLIMKGTTKKIAFHQKTRFPLEGAHVTVPCKACHGPWPGQKAKFRGIPFRHCYDCHMDAHVGQLAKSAGDCDACHTVFSFTPSTFGIAAHQKTRYPLAGAHQAVACNLCHTPDRSLLRRVPANVKRKMHHEGRKVVVSTAQLTFHGRAERCVTCHQNPHGNQFAGESGSCERCHEVSSWKDLKFDHDKDSRFPLAGGHAKVACGKCHFKTERIGGKNEIVYKPLSMACESCHTDVHMGQFAGTRTSQCKDCHKVTTWKDLKFVHRPPFTRYRLLGEHAKVDCSKCHMQVTVLGKRTARYRPLPTKTCAGCHADFHKGAFASLEDKSGRPEDCVACHTVKGWSIATFDHDKTGFPLKGAHKTASCWGCHTRDLKAPVPKRCAACHQDAHGGQLGARCQSCHNESDWHAAFTPADHAKTGFPLTGRHATIPCTECHMGAREKTFTRVSAACADCHLADLAKVTPSVDHKAAGFSNQCQQCHNAFRFAPAKLPGHDTCFLINSGPHVGIRCRDCHTTVPGGKITGACNTGTATCTTCHAHNQSRSDRQHQNVPGYQFKDQKCYECHRFAQ